jgi:hypothetical protein
MKKTIKLLLAATVFFVAGCKKSNDSYSSPNDVQQGQRTAHANARENTDVLAFDFSFDANGPFTYTPISATIIKIHQDFAVSHARPFPLTTGYLEGYDDLTIPTFPARFFNGTWKFSGPGGSTIYGGGTVQTSVFSDPIDPLHGDLNGKEYFTGTFTITGGMGIYEDAVGSGTYTANSEWLPPTAPGMLLSGTTIMHGTGTVSVPKNGHH